MHENSRCLPQVLFEIPVTLTISGNFIHRQYLCVHQSQEPRIGGPRWLRRHHRCVPRTCFWKPVFWVASGTLFEISIGDISVFENTPALRECFLGVTKVTGKLHRTFFWIPVFERNLLARFLGDIAVFRFCPELETLSLQECENITGKLPGTCSCYQ